MANQQLFPNSTYPITGDVQSTPGSPFVRVVGIQTFPFSPAPPLVSQVPVFDGSQWIPSSVTLSDNDSISVAGVSVSDDYELSVNRIDTEVQVNSSFSPHGFPILAAGTPVNTP
jgi:hypothetical protein